MRACFLVLLLSGLAAAAPAPIDSDTLDMVKAFLKMPVKDMPSEFIPKFLAVEEEALPQTLRERFRGRKLELYTLKHLSEGKKRGVVRMPEAGCAAFQEADGMGIKVLLLAGYAEINEYEEGWLMRRTQCTEHDMMCEFSLLVRIETVNGRKQRRLFLHPSDPLMALVASYRADSHVSTNFFGLGGVTCAPRSK